MDELIKINDKGLVSTKELYLGLGLNKTNWSRWYPKNIEKNEFFKENTDWIGVRHYDEGNETMDFAISLEFAKHIAMMARTEKSHQYRNYFLACEAKLIENQNLISAKEEIKELKSTLEDFKRATEEAKRQFHPCHKRKLDYNKMIKNIVGDNKEYVEGVKDMVFAQLHYDKWEDASTEDNNRIVNAINVCSRFIMLNKFEQLSMF